MNNDNAAKLLRRCLKEVRRAEDRMERAEIGSLAYSEASGREYAYLHSAEAIASWSDDLGELFDQTVSELWPEGPTR